MPDSRGDSQGILGAAAILFVGNSAARFLGLLFLVVAAHLLVPAQYGTLAYALAVANFAQVLVTNAPTGLARFLAHASRNHDDQVRYFSNWLAMIAGMLGISLVALVPIALLAGLGGWMLLGLAANLVGVAVFGTYREAQHGQERFRSMVAFYITANLVQLVSIVVFGLAGLRDPALFLTIYGLSNLVALALVGRVARIGLPFDPSALSRPRLLQAIRFTLPLVGQTAFFAVWFGADLVLVDHLLSSTAAGNYAAAKTLVTIIGLPAGAISSTVLPRVARLSSHAKRRYLARALGMTSVIVLPLAAILALFRGPIVSLVFGAKYPLAIEAIPGLAVGMGCYAFYMVMESTFIGLGHPEIDAVATAAGMITTVLLGVVTIRQGGLAAAAVAFAAGAAMQLVVIAAFSVLRVAERGPWRTSAVPPLNGATPAAVTVEDPLELSLVGGSAEPSGRVRASVVIPSFNRARRLARVLQALDRQDADPGCMEVIVVLDGGWDDSEQRLKETAPAYDLRWVSQPNVGIGGARNKGAELARGDVVIFLDDDILPVDGMVRAHLEAHKRRPGGLVQGAFPATTEALTKGGTMAYDRALSRSLAAVEESQPSTWNIWGGHFSIDRATLASLGGFDTANFSDYGGEDTDLGLRAAAAGVPFTYEPGATGQHLHQPDIGAQRRQAYAEGRSVVKLAALHHLPLVEFFEPESRDAIVSWLWRRPMVAAPIGRCLGAGLWLADHLGPPRSRLVAARVLHRYYKLGGILHASSQLGIAYSVS
jgi:O-antigen/teichoic acid export membrane protein/GT2 family glycosyltransferase